MIKRALCTLAVMLLSLAGCDTSDPRSTLNEDIIPSENLGKLIITKPDLTQHADKDASSYIAVSLKKGTTYTNLSLNTEYKVPAGEHCISTVHNNEEFSNIRVETCGFLVKKGQTTTVGLAAFNPDLKEDALITELGPKAILRIGTNVPSTPLVLSAENILKKEETLSHSPK